MTEIGAHQFASFCREFPSIVLADVSGVEQTRQIAA